MSAANVCLDLDDAEALLAADRQNLLHAAATAGARVRATAAAVAEGALESVADESRPRTVIWVAGRGPAQSAGVMLDAVLAGVAGQPLVRCAAPPPWIGPLDMLVVAGDDPGDPVLVGAAATAVRRGARVVVAAPYEGPLRDATAGRAAVLAPRLWAPDEFGLCRYLAVGLAALAAVDPGVRPDLEVLADALDAEALRNSAAREAFTNPAKSLADRMAGRPSVLAGDGPATLALAQHGAAVMLRVAGRPVAAVGLADALAAGRAGLLAGSPGDTGDARRYEEHLFHDEQIDGPRPARTRVFALALAEERRLLAAAVAGIGDADLLGVQDVGDPDMRDGDIGDGASVPTEVGSTEAQLSVLALRLEMAAVYLRLAGG